MKLSGTGFRNGAITLDEHNAVYYPAQTISGNIVFELQEHLSFSAINVTYQGEANVFWTEPQSQKYSGVKKYMNVDYKDNDNYFNFTQCVYGGNGATLPTGQHSIPFSYQIPYTAPSTFHSAIGSVTYKIIASLECPPVMREELVKTFEVVAPLDLNKDTTGEIKRPINMEFEEVYTCCCFSKLITVGVDLPVSGYCPGQVMPITVDVKNDSSLEISKMLFQLVMKERYRSRTPLSENVLPEKVLATLKKGPIRGNIKRQFQWGLKVPDMIAPNLGNCSIIDIRYFFKVTIKFPGCMDDLQDEREVYLGMIPLEITTGGNAYVHPLKHRLPRGLPPLGMPLPYGNNNGTDQSSLITHIPLRSPQMARNHTNPTTFQAVTSPQVCPYPGPEQFLPSAPMEPSPYPFISNKSPIIHQPSPSPVYPYPVQHQTLVTASIENNPRTVNSYPVQNSSPVKSVLSGSYQSVNEEIQNQFMPKVPSSPDSIHYNRFQENPQTTPIQSTSPSQNKSPITAPVETINPHQGSPIIHSTHSTPKETCSPHSVNSNPSPQRVHVYPIQNHSLPSTPKKSTSPSLGPLNRRARSASQIYPNPEQHQSFLTASIETGYTHLLSTCPVQNKTPVKNQIPLILVIPPTPLSAYLDQLQSPTSSHHSMDRQGSPVPIHSPKTANTHVEKKQS